MAEAYRYNVIIEVGVDPSNFQQGKEQVKAQLREWEQEVTNSQKRMSQVRQNEVEGERNRQREMTSIYQQRLEQLQSSRMKELNYEREVLKQAEFAEMQSYAKRLALHESFVNSLNRQANIANPQTQARNSVAGQGTVTGGFTASTGSTSEVDFINAQTRAQARQQQLLRQYATSQNNTALGNMRGEINAIDKATEKGAKSWGMWGQAFKGAFIGATAGIAFSTIVSGISNIASGIVDFVKTSVEMAGKLEQTTNALTVFTGSANIARQELADLDEVARTTTGLSLPSAREGYQELRALNFEASLSRNLIAGIGKERLLSGADEQSVQRVVTNLVQLSAGSSRASQDVKEMIHAIPRLGLEFQKAYGTLDFKEIGQQFKNDPDKALRKLADAMNEAKGASGGFLDAQMKLGDEIQRVQEKAGQPLMKALTSDIIYLTQAIHDNESMFIRWGIQIENTYAGLSKIGSWIAKYNTISMIGGEGLAGSFINKFLINGGVTNIAEAIGENRNHTAIQAENTYDQVRIATINAQIANQRKAEQQEAARLAMARGNYATTQAGTKNAFRLAQAGLDSTMRNTPQDEMAYVRASSQLKANQYSIEYEQAKQHYNQMWELNKGKDEELYKLNEEFIKDTQKFNADRVENELKTGKQIAEIEKQIANERRQNNIEFIKLQGQAIQQGYDQRTVEIERYLTQTDKLEQDSFDQLKQLTIGTYDSLIEKNRDTLELQLMDKTLSVEKIRNLQKQSGLEEVKLENEKANKLYEINEKFIERKLQLLEQALQKQVSMLNDRQFELNSAGSLLSLDMFSADSFNAFQANTFGGNPNTIPQSFTDKQAMLRSQYDATTNARQTLFKDYKNADKSLATTKALGDEIERLDVLTRSLALTLQVSKDGQKAWTESLTEGQLEINKLAESVINGTASLDVFDKIAEKIAEGKYFIEIQKLQAESAKLNESLKTKYDPNIVTQQRQIDSQIGKLMSERDLEVLKAKREAVKGLNEEIGKLNNNDAITIFKMIADLDKGLTTQARDSVKEGKQTELILRNENLLTIYREIEAQKTYNELLGKELSAVISIDKSRALIADQMVYHKNQADASVLEYVASQKGLTDIISDAKINLMTNAFSALDNVIQKMTRSFGFASDAVSQFLSGIIKLSLNRLFLKMFGVDLNGNSKGGFTATADGGAFGGGGGAGGNGGVADVISQALHGRGASGTASNPLALLHGLGGFGTPNGMPSTGSTMLGASGEQAFSVNGSELLGAGASSGSSTLTAGRVGVGASLGAMLPLLGLSLGMGLGGRLDGNSLSKTLGLLGGGAVGVGAGLIGGGLLLGGATGIGMAAIGATTLGLGALPLIAAFIISKNAKRRKEETQRDKAMVDAFASLDKLISDVQSDKLDGVSALSQADQIRTSYLDEMGKLKDDKTRRIALADVSRIDAKISLLKSAVSSQQRRQDRLTQLVPTFGDGGNVSNFIGSNYANNPLGYQTGSKKVGWFENAQTFAQYNELGHEYIFDHQTTRNIGVRDLDTIRATKGASYLAMKQRFSPKAMMSGGEVSSVPNISSFAPSASSNTSSASAKPTQLNASFNLTIGQDTFIEAVSGWIEDEGGQAMLEVIATLNQNQSNNKLTQSIVDNLRQRGLV